MTRDDKRALFCGLLLRLLEVFCVVLAVVMGVREIAHGRADSAAPWFALSALLGLGIVEKIVNARGERK